MDDWYLPITILPSVGFFIMATSNISNALSAEIARLIEMDAPSNRRVITRKINQLWLLNTSLVFLYVSAMLLTLAGLIAGLEANFMIALHAWVAILVCLAIGMILAAFCMLIVYAYRAVSIKRQQFSQM